MAMGVPVITNSGVGDVKEIIEKPSYAFDTFVMVAEKAGEAEGVKSK